jgi:hypothetical protein
MAKGAHFGDDQIGPSSVEVDRDANPDAVNVGLVKLGGLLKSYSRKAA